MFNALKKSIGNVLSKFKRSVDQEVEETDIPDEEEIKREVMKGAPVEKPREEKKPRKKAPLEKPREELEGKPQRGWFGRLIQGREEEKPEEPEKEKPAEEGEPQEEKQSWLGKRMGALTKVKLTEAKFEDLFWEMEISLLENNMAAKVINKIKEDLKAKLVDKPISRKRIGEGISKSLQNSIKEVLSFNVPDIIKTAKGKKPFVILFVGVNGSGKTTTIAKICKLFQDKKKKCIMVASDTFRAAAIQQLEEHANRLGVKMIKHDYGSDPAAVAFDGIRYAKAHDIDIVLVDTAGRLHTNKNLMDELKKVKRVANPDLILYIGESITGNDCIEQARVYEDEIGIDGIVLTKVDVDEKGGTAISIAYVIQKPIWLIGDGQNYEDIRPFDSNKVLDSLGF